VGSRRALGWASLWLAALACSACGGPASPPLGAVVADLVAELPLAEVRREVAEIDLGTAAARPHLASGWSWDETAGDGASFVWSEGERSELTFFLSARRDIHLAFRVLPLSYPGAPDQGLAVEVNGLPVGRLDLPRQWTEPRLRLSRESLAAGENRLALSYRWNRSPAEVGMSQDARRLAVAWDWIRLEGVEEAAAPGADAAVGRLLLPTGIQVDYYLDLPAGSALAIDGSSASPGTQVQVLLGWESAPALGGERGDGEPVGEVVERQVGRFGFGGARSWRFPERPGGPVRLSLRAVVGEGGSAQGAVLQAPRVLAPPAAASPAGGASRIDPADGEAGGPAGEEASEAGPARGAVAPRDGQAAARAGQPARQGTGRPPNVVLYLVDTLRADHLGVYGEGRGLTPHLDAFAREATLFEDATAPSSWTRPSVASLLTGLAPQQHRVNRLEQGLPAEALLLSERLQASGYRTAAFVANAHIAATFGFARGFDRFEPLFEGPNRASDVHRRLLTWLEGTAREPTPFFLYVHTIDPHAPYEPPEEFRRRFAPEADTEVGSFEAIRAVAERRRSRTPRVEADLAALYAAEVAEADAAFGELLGALKARGLYEASFIAFVADHGEEFFEHGVLGHGWDLYREVLAVPLLLRRPGDARGRRVARPARLEDLVPTVLAQVGSPVPEGLAGTDLFLDRVGDRPIVSYQDYEGRRGASLVLGPWHLIEPLGGGFARGTELYHRPSDPGERENLAASRPVLAGYLRRLLRSELAQAEAAPAPRPVDLDAETRRRLEALGYVR
jgi:arylsulfatase A-like enzyme